MFASLPGKSRFRRRAANEAALLGAQLHIRGLVDNLAAIECLSRRLDLVQRVVVWVSVRKIPCKDKVLVQHLCRQTKGSTAASASGALPHGRAASFGALRDAHLNEQVQADKFIVDVQRCVPRTKRGEASPCKQAGPEKLPHTKTSIQLGTPKRPAKQPVRGRAWVWA